MHKPASDSAANAPNMVFIAVPFDLASLLVEQLISSFDPERNYRLD
jgi:hypothetical protein